jgi:hypothetical protein
MTKHHVVPVLELRRLLYELKDQRPDISVRFRIMGEMWQNYSHRIFELTEKGVLLKRGNQLVSIHDLNTVMQFEIDQPYQNFEPLFHYAVETELVH